MKLFSVSVGRPRDVVVDDRLVLTSIFKSRVAGRIPVRDNNLAGDAQSDLSVHGGRAKAIYAYPHEHYGFWREQLPGVDLQAYKRKLIERFSNEYVADTVARLCAESSDRIPKWLMPVVRENLAAGRPVELSAAIVASWARYAEQLTAVAQRNREDLDAFIANRELFGDVVDDERFRSAYRDTLASLHSRGAIATLEKLVGTPVSAA